MNKTWIVLKSEFLRRVQSKWFIIGTLLAPLFMLALTVGSGVLAIMGAKGEQRAIAVVDETGRLLPRLQAAGEDGLRFEATTVPTDSVRAAVHAGRFDGYLHLPRGLDAGQGQATYYSVEGGGLSLGPRLEGLVDRAVEEHRLAEVNASPQVREILKARIPVRMVKLTVEGEETDSVVAYTIVGYFMGFMIYLVMFLYGAWVMQGVMEEKTNRVVEVMVSSVRPFHLLMGKVLGIGAVGLVQMAVWSVMILAGTTYAGMILALFVDPSQFNLPATATEEELMMAANFQMPELSPLLFVWFILFFLGGYLLYASLFAAIGSAVENQQDAQGLMFPVSMLIIVPIIFMSFLIESPNAPASVVLSMIPFFSPILMVVRTAVTHVPLWQVLLSLVLLAATFVGAVWMSARIYRVGILSYGKKPTLADLVRWFRYA